MEKDKAVSEMVKAWASMWVDGPVSEGATEEWHEFLGKLAEQLFTYSETPFYSQESLVEWCLKEQIHAREVIGLPLEVAESVYQSP